MNYKLLINKIIIIFIFLKIITFSNLLFSQGFSNFEEQLLPEIILFDENKIKTNLSSYLKNSNHRLTIINFWATWCKPCLDEMPSLNKLQANKKFKSLKIIPINVGQEGLSKLVIFFDKLNIDNLEIFFDETVNLPKKFSLRGLPTSILFNKNGDEFARIIGAIDFSDDQFIEWLLSYEQRQLK